MSARDPRTDPRPGDRISVGLREYRIGYITATGTIKIDIYLNGKYDAMTACDAPTWRRWMKDAEVLYAAD